jgi:hypothetical protein
MSAKLIKPTNENLGEIAAPLLARWLVEVAQHQTTLAYGAALDRLEKEVGFSSIGRATRLGYPAGRLMEDIQLISKNAPLLNILLVLQSDDMPSTGAGWFLAEHFGVAKLKTKNFRSRHPVLWRRYFEKAAKEVYDYRHWDKLIDRVYPSTIKYEKSSLSALSADAGTEREGIPRGRKGEGPTHKALRLWARDNPGAVVKRARGCRSETEVELPSGDRVDVVYFTEQTTYAVEVKSRISNDADFERGVYQCVKYRAVLQAMNPYQTRDIRVILLTERKLPGYLEERAKSLGIMQKEVWVGAKNS